MLCLCMCELPLSIKQATNKLTDTYAWNGMPMWRGDSDIENGVSTASEQAAHDVIVNKAHILLRFLAHDNMNLSLSHNFICEKAKTDNIKHHSPLTAQWK